MIDINILPEPVRNYLSYMETIKGKSKNTVTQYFYDLKNFFMYIKAKKLNIELTNEIDISDITADFIKKINLSDLYDYMFYANRNLENKPRTRARKVSSIRSMFKYLTEKESILAINPAQNLDSPKIPKNLPRYLKLEESQALLRVINNKFRERDFAIITMFLNCGMRLSELVSINIDDIRENTLVVMGKGEKERTIYLNEACMMAIEAYLSVRSTVGVRDKKALFISNQKKRISHRMVQVLVKKYLKIAGLDSNKYSPHKLRHTAATLMYQYGNTDMKSLQEILGHESVATTEIYTHITQAHLEQAINNHPLANFKTKKKF